MAKTLPPTKGMLTGDGGISTETPETQTLNNLLSLLQGIGQADLAALWLDPTIEEIITANSIRMNPEAPTDIQQAEGVTLEAVSQLVTAVENARTEAQNIVDTMVNNPEALTDMEDPGPLVTSFISAGAQSFAGTPVTTATPPAAGGEYVVISGGAGVTVSTENILKTGGRIFGETVQVVQRDSEGNPVLDQNGDPVVFDEYQPGILDAIIPYIPGVSLPDWMPSAGVIFLPTVGEAINKIEEVVAESGISEATEGGDLGGILGAIGEIIVGAGSAAVGVLEKKVGEIVNGILGTITDPTRAGTIIGGVLGNAFPSIPSWLPPLITDPRVRSAVSNVLTQEYDADPNLFAEEEVVDINEDDTTYIDDTIKADVKFPEDPDPIGDGEVIVQDPDKTDGQMGTAPVMDPIQPAPEPEIVDPIEEFIDPEPEPEVEEEDESIVEDLFSDIIGQTEANILQAIADAGYATPQDVIDAINEAGLLTPENLATTLANAGFATPEDIGTALANAGFATPEDITTALAAAGFATPEDLVTALSNAGFATPEDIVTALSESGLATPEDIATALTNAGLATPQDIADAFEAAGLATPQDITDAISAAGLATPEDIANALEQFGFTDEQLQQIVGVLPENLTVEQLNTALTEALSGLPTGTDLDTATTTITDAISGLSFATAEDVRNALAEFGFTEEQLQQIVGALPEGLSLSDLDTALEGIVVGADLDTAVTTITDAIGGLDVASPDDVRNILANYGFTDAQLQQIVGALPEGLSLSEVTTALDTALSGIALGTDLDTATTTITDAIGGLAFATPADVANALAEFGFSEDQLNQIAGVIPEGLSLNDLNTALGDALEGIALGTDLETATGTITDAIGGLSFATAEDIQTALTGFNFTESQLNQISDLLPDNLTESQVQDLLNTALTGVSTQEDVDTAFETLTTNLNLSLGDLEAGQEDILTGQEGLLGGQEQIRDIIGEETQSLEDIIVTSTGLLGALGAGGGGAPAPRPQPFQKYLEKLEYAPEKVQMVQQTPKTDYQKEVDRLLMFGRAPQQPPRKPGMLV
jgi:Holliday junction resolvasome RuvABC DNA-binding subunit